MSGRGKPRILLLGLDNRDWERHRIVFLFEFVYSRLHSRGWSWARDLGTVLKKSMKLWRVCGELCGLCAKIRSRATHPEQSCRAGRKRGKIQNPKLCTRLSAARWHNPALVKPLWIFQWKYPRSLIHQHFIQNAFHWNSETYDGVSPSEVRKRVSGWFLQHLLNPSPSLILAIKVVLFERIYEKLQ